MRRKSIGILIQDAADAGGFHDSIFGALVTCFEKLPDLNLFILNGGHLDSMDANYPGATAFGDTFNKIYKLVDAYLLDGLIIIYTIGNFISPDEFSAFCRKFKNCR